MNRIHLRFMMNLMLLPAACFAQSAFVGTWRPEPQKADPNGKPDVLEVGQGMYFCKSCDPSIEVPTDAKDHPVKAAYYDTLSVAVVDEHTVLKIQKMHGATFGKTLETVSTDGKRRTDIQSISGMGPRAFNLAVEFSRLSSGPRGSHALSGSWKEIQADLVNHEEDTTYTLSGNTLNMSDQFGRSFSAKLDGTEAPYQGDPEVTSVKLKLIDSRTIEETGLNAGQVVKISRWNITPDGDTMHATFDDTHGHVQHQDGHRLK